MFFKVHGKPGTLEGENLKRAGSIVVSVVFRPVPSLLKTGNNIILDVFVQMQTSNASYCWRESSE